MLKSPTVRLVAGLAFTLLVIGGFAFFTLRSVWRMRDVQTRIVDRNRLASLQLIRIQNELNTLGLAMRDMLDESAAYPLAAWRAPFVRVRENLDDAIAREASLSSGLRPAAQSAYLATSLADFWRAAESAMALAERGEQRAALNLVRNTLQPRAEALTALTARLLVGNHDEEAKASDQVRALYAGIERNAYVLLALSLALIVLTSAGLIRSNRTLFRRLSDLADRRRELARQLISTQESAFRAISRDLHDEFGQILTALGAMLSRAQAQAPDSAYRAQAQEASVVVQGTLERIRSLSQSLHPVMLEEQGLAAAVAWHIESFQRHTHLAVRYTGPPANLAMPPAAAIHVFRILQEALNNAARHAQAEQIEARLEVRDGALHLTVTDDGVGIAEGARREGLGLAAMRERAELLGGAFSIAARRPARSGTVVRLHVPLGDAPAPAALTMEAPHGV
ncbi:MAG: sensor histidine kinase [Bryobacterales bacterium]|nr:sensor histidine kinase [Bryobacterales bacterium]